jgi:hypothetical protein
MPPEHWSSSSDWCLEAEAAAVLRDVDGARTSVALLTPLSGRMAVSGISTSDGPVDGYLALALATAGETTAATEAADRAVALAAEWDLPAYTRWLTAHRERWGF